MRFNLLSLMIALCAAIGLNQTVVWRRSRNEIEATMMLYRISRAEADFRSNDRDGNLVNDFWTGDVYGLHAYGNGIALIPSDTAFADARSRRGDYPSVPPGREGSPIHA